LQGIVKGINIKEQHTKNKKRKRDDHMEYLKYAAGHYQVDVDVNKIGEVPEKDQTMTSLETLHNSRCTVCHSEHEVRKFILGGDWHTIEFRLCRNDREKLIQFLFRDLQPQEESWQDVVYAALDSGITDHMIEKIAKGEK
jgi:hypothetical protein